MVTMGSTQIKVQDDILEQLKKEEGNSWSKRIANALKQKIQPTDSVEVDYDEIKRIIDKSIVDALIELKEGRL